MPQTININGKQYQFNRTGSSQQSKNEPARGFLDSLTQTNTLPAAGSALGTLLGGLVGGSAGSVVPGAGTLVGGVAGAGAGGAIGGTGGKILQEELQNLFGKQTDSRQEQISQVGATGVESGVTGATAEFGGQILGKLLGLVGRPLGKFIYRSGLKIPQKVSEKAVKIGTDPAEQFIQEGLRGKPGKLFAKIKQELLPQTWSNLKTAVDNSPVKKKVLLTAGELLTKLSEAKTGFGDSKSLARGVESVFQDIIDKHGISYTLEDLVEMNTTLNSSLFRSGAKTTSNAAKQVARDSIDELIRGTVYEASSEVGSLLQRYGMFRDLADTSLKTGASAVKGNPIRNVLQAVNIPFRLLNNPATSSVLGTGVYNLPNITRTVSPTINYLKNLNNK